MESLQLRLLANSGVVALRSLQCLNVRELALTILLMCTGLRQDID